MSEEAYFDWMCRLVSAKERGKLQTWDKLLRYLNGREFVYILRMDRNRACDGVNLRYLFSSNFDLKKPCSILEMMIALCIRCEDHIMYDNSIGDRTSYWFWNMIDTLGLSDFYDSAYDEDSVRSIVDAFINREYESNGEGGLFRVMRSDEDMRDVEIWYQMMLYLNEYIATQS